MANFWDNDAPAKVPQPVRQAAAVVQSTVKDVTKQSGSILQSVVSQASQLMSSGAEFASDATESFVDAAPEMVENVQESARVVSDVAGKASTGFKVLTSPVALNFLDDLVFGRERAAIGINAPPRSEDYLSPETIDLLKVMIKDRGGIKPGQKLVFSKEIYATLSKKYGSQIKVVQTGGSGSKTIINALANRNPADEIKNTLGAFSVKADEDGNMVIVDKFNYNEWKHPVTGEEYSPEGFDKAVENGDFTVSEMIGKSWEKYGASYGYVRSLGFLLGSRGYVDEEGKETQGREFVLQLGNISDL
jgi:hypothetical protein